MFKKSINSKSSFFNSDGVMLKDLSESIFKLSSYHLDFLASYYTVSSELRMRPDKISSALYGSDEYAEIIMKHSGIDNPFAIDEGDLLLAPTLNSIYHNIKDIDEFANSGMYTNDELSKNKSVYDAVKKYHKYIDKSKLPNSNSEENNTNVLSIAEAEMLENQNRFDTTFGNFDNLNSSSSTSSDIALPIEANIANNGRSGIHVENGRIYFGNSVSASSNNLADIRDDIDVSSNLVDCAKNGVTLGQFLYSVIKNNSNKS